MNIYLLSQSENTGYCSYEGCIVIAPDEETARRISPDERGFPEYCLEEDLLESRIRTRNWAAHPIFVRVQFLGIADSYLGNRPRVIFAVADEIGAPDELLDYLQLETSFI